MHTRAIFIGFPLIALLAFAAYADTGDRYHKAGVSCAGMKLSNCPAGDFELIRKGCNGEGDYIWIEARDAANRPIPGIPWTDYWIGGCDQAQPIVLCVEGFVADSLTGENGRTTFSSAIRAGGCVSSGGIWIAIQGERVRFPQPYGPVLCLDVIVKSPDLTGSSGAPDGIVNLSDLVVFGASYHTALGVSPPPGKEFNPCCDYTDDNSCNLSDFAFLGQHYQHHCP